MLAHQLRVLPPFEHFWNALGGFFEWLEGTTELTALGSIPARGATPTFVPRPRIPTRISSALEEIRFAAANRLCVDLRYGGRTRLIEPYSLRRSSRGDILLYATHAGTAEVRSYRLDRIQGAGVTSTPFIPMFAMELSPSGPVSIPRATRRAPVRVSTGGRRSSRGTSDWRCVVECNHCGKRFYRKKYSTRIKPHKDRDGYLR